MLRQKLEPKNSLSPIIQNFSILVLYILNGLIIADLLLADLGLKIWSSLVKFGHLNCANRGQSQHGHSFLTSATLFRTSGATWNIL